MEVAADGTGLHGLPIHGCCGAWSANGEYYFYRTDRDIWVLPEQRSIFSAVQLGASVQVTAGPLVFRAPLPSADGKQLFVLGTQRRIQLVHYDTRSQRLTPFLGGISAGELEVSPDGQWATYTTFPESALWRSKLDGSERLQLTFPPINAHEPRWSPDGKQILFEDFPHKIYVVSADGGSPRPLMPEDHPDLIGAGAWLPDGSSIIFVRVMGCTFFGERCFRQAAAIYRLDLKTQQISKLPDSDGFSAARLSRDGRYLTALPADRNTVMLYDLQAERWSELAQDYGSIAWSHDSKSVYMIRGREGQAAELVRISVPDGKTERVLDLKDVTLGGYWDWVSLLPDDSALLTLDKSNQEIYRLDLQYH
jgi:dipeptidyl aminopeptidase/acylaminoacyl peptidase